MNKQDFIDQVERAYRRGFHQAVAEAGRVLRQENDQKYNRWLEAVRLWRNEVNPDELDKCALFEGQLQADENGNPEIWTDREGKAHSSFQMIANQVVFLSPKDDGERVETDDIPF